MDALRPLWDAERPGLHSHAERGNDQPRTNLVQHFRRARFRALTGPGMHFLHLLKHLFGTLVRKLLLSISRKRSSNNHSAPQALILVLRD